MRIISGEFKGRPIHPPQNLPVRPTTDKAKESLFNILANNIDFEDLKVLDLFAGTGNISYEFASRGALEITAVDADFRCAKFIKTTAETLKMPIKTIRANVFSFLSTEFAKYDLIFADPPYDLERLAEIPDLIINQNILNEDGVFILEHSSDHNFSKHPWFKNTRTYSKVNFSFFEKPN